MRDSTSILRALVFLLLMTVVSTRAQADGLISTCTRWIRSLIQRDVTSKAVEAKPSPPPPSTTSKRPSIDPERLAQARQAVEIAFRDLDQTPSSESYEVLSTKMRVLTNAIKDFLDEASVSYSETPADVLIDMSKNRGSFPTLIIMASNSSPLNRFAKGVQDKYGTFVEFNPAMLFFVGMEAYHRNNYGTSYLGLSRASLLDLRPDFAVGHEIIHVRGKNTFVRNSQSDRDLALFENFQGYLQLDPSANQHFQISTVDDYERFFSFEELPAYWYSFKTSINQLKQTEDPQIRLRNVNTALQYAKIFSQILDTTTQAIDRVAAPVLNALSKSTQQSASKILDPNFVSPLQTRAELQGIYFTPADIPESLVFLIVRKHPDFRPGKARGVLASGVSASGVDIHFIVPEDQRVVQLEQYLSSRSSAPHERASDVIQSSYAGLYLLQRVNRLSRLITIYQAAVSQIIKQLDANLESSTDDGWDRCSDLIVSAEKSISDLIENFKNEDQNDPIHFGSYLSPRK